MAHGQRFAECMGDQRAKRIEGFERTGMWTFADHTKTGPRQIAPVDVDRRRKRAHRQCRAQFIPPATAGKFDIARPICAAFRGDAQSKQQGDYQPLHNLVL